MGGGLQERINEATIAEEFWSSRDLFDGPGGLADTSQRPYESFLSREVEEPAAPALHDFVSGEGPPILPRGRRSGAICLGGGAQPSNEKLYQAWMHALPTKKYEWRTVEAPPTGFQTSSEHGFISRMEHPVCGVREYIRGGILCFVVERSGALAFHILNFSGSSTCLRGICRPGSLSA